MQKVPAQKLRSFVTCQICERKLEQSMGKACVSTVLVPTAQFCILQNFQLIIYSFTDIDEWGVYVYGN